MTQSVDFSPIVRGINDGFRDMEYRLNELGGEVGQVRRDIGGVQSDVATTRQELMALRHEFSEFLQRHERQRLVQLAETRLGTLKADLEREYGHYGVVRRTSVGILQAFDIGNVRNKTVHELSEELMIQTPRYWLAPALVALAAWSKDDQELAEKSIEAAFARDSKKTSLFFALVLRRQARLADAARWLRHYFVSLDPRALTREFAVLLEAAAQDGFGPEGRELVLEHLTRWRDILRDEPELVTAQVEKWRHEVETHRGTIDDSMYSHLAHHSPGWPVVKSVLEAASAHGYVTATYTEVRDATATLSASVADRLDDLLELLVTEFDGEELPLRREVLYQEAIIQHDGDEDRAKQQADLDVAALDEVIDALSLQTHTALTPDLLGVSVSTQQVAVGACKEDFTSAIGQFSRDYRAQWPERVQFVLDGNHSSHAQAFQFGTWTVESDTPPDQAETSLATHWEQVFAAFIESRTFRWSRVIGEIAGGVAAFVVGLLLCFTGSVPVILIGVLAMLGGPAFAAFLIWRRQEAARADVAGVEKVRGEAVAKSVELYRTISAEWVDARLVYEEEDVREAELLELLEGWTH
ncbi:MAG: hypothetical protein QM597_01005 [Aeromicrobium sp.]|uniref:hypothetical protein n=1 Tax=Aeromicrobium sp. TaxID=1871063 RepID=UPI0039E6E2F6